jgi:hypothetical protein
MSIYSYCMFLYLHCASWQSSATLTEIFPCYFLSCKANAWVKTAEIGHGPHSFKIFVLFYVLCFVSFCLCVNVYCTALLPQGGYPTAVIKNISTKAARTHTHTHTHTQGIRYTYCFSTATMITYKRLNFTCIRTAPVFTKDYTKSITWKLLY